jgi:diaphanous 1
LKALQSACKELTDSKKFKKILEVILKMGNFLNGGTFNANAPGFKIDALGKVFKNQ